MKLIEQLNNFCKGKTPVFINGMGAGRIKEVLDDYILFETSRVEETKKGETILKETIIISLSAVNMLSEGEKEVPKSDAEKEAEKDLEGI